MFALLVERLQLRPVEDLVANRVGQVLEPAIEIADLEALRSAAAACVTDQPEHDDRDHEQGNDPGHRLGKKQGVGRSEEHTSELQSLMRISYAVFCLTKKNNDTHHHKIPKINTK